MGDEAFEGCILRSKEQWTERGETPTRYFFQLENTRQSFNAIHELRVDSNTTVKTSWGILKESNAFYKTLCTEEPTDCMSQDWLLEQLDSTLSSEDQTLCEEELLFHKWNRVHHREWMASWPSFIPVFGASSDAIWWKRLIFPFLRDFSRPRRTRESCVYCSRKMIPYRSKIGDLSRS